MENKKSEDCSPKPKYVNAEKLEIEKSELEERKLKAAKNILSSTIKGENDSDKGVRTQVLKRKLTEDGVAIERVLSEGETSSGFETVSPINSNKDDFDDLDDLELSSLDDCDNENKDDFNVIVRIENELAYRNIKETEKRKFYKKDYSSGAYKYEKDHYSCEQAKDRLHKDRYCKRIRCQDSNCNYKHYKSSRRDKQSSESTDYSRRPSSCQRERYSKDSDRKSRWSDSRSRRSKSSEKTFRSRRSKSSEKTFRSRRSRSSEKTFRPRRSRSSEKTFRSRNSRTPDRKARPRSSSIKDRKAESRHSGNFDKYSSSSRRSSPVRKRRRSSFSRSPPSVWSRLDSPLNSTRGKKERTTSRRNSISRSSRKKERTPFLVELERKLKEAENSKKEAKMMHAGDTGLVPQVPMVLQQNLNFRRPLPLPTVPVIEGVYDFQYQLLPTLSTDNLPLVPGPTGLPVFITPTGEQIPHDMDGKRIPVGPNGCYLPVDPLGRLFPHIISPMNLAIPIHMTDDGVVRLPNSEPVPYGPSHQLPVNVDGSVIYIGPDSKALYPYRNLPRAPPPHLLKIMNTFGKNAGTQQAVQEMSQNQLLSAQSVPQPQQSSGSFKALEIDLTATFTAQNHPEGNDNEDLLKNQKQTKDEKTKRDLASTETHNNLDSTQAVKRSCPVQGTVQSKAPRNNSPPEVILESSDSVLEAKTVSGSDKGSNKADAVTQKEEQGFLEIVCGNKSFTIPTADLLSNNLIVRKVEHGIKSLSEKNYKPPVFGRFIISNFSSDLVARKFPNESPLLRNRVKLPFITPNAKHLYSSNKPASVEKTKVSFKFLPQKSDKGERLSGCRNNRVSSTGATKRPVFTFDFAMQCDFTSVIIKNLNSKVLELENEVVRLKKAKASLLENYTNAQAMKEKKSDELRKALLEIQEKNSEILSLKCSLKVKE